MESGSFKVVGGAAIDTYMMYNGLQHAHKYQADLYEDTSKLGVTGAKTVSREDALSKSYDIVILNSIRDVPLALLYRERHPLAKFMYIDRGNVITNFRKAGMKRLLPKMMLRYKYLLQLKTFLNQYVAITAEQYEMAKDFFDTVKTELHYINIAPHKEFRSLGLDRSDGCAIVVGRLDERQKKMSFLFRGITRVVSEHPELKNQLLLRVVGTGPDEIRYKSMVNSLGISTNVVFDGFVRGEPLVTKYNTARFLVSTSEWESPGRSFLEAMACGLPVLLNTKNNAILNYSPVENVVRDGYNGVVYAYNDLEDFAEKFYALCHRPALARKLGEHAHSYIKKFSFEHTLKEYESILDTM